MGTRKEKAFEHLKHNFDNYSNLVVKQLRMLETLIETDSQQLFEQQYAEIKQYEKEINTFDVKFSEEIINLIVLYAPVATELRRLMALNRVSLNLEKIGDLVTNIAKSLRKMQDQRPLIGYSDTLNEIFIIAVKMVEKSLCAINNNDMDYAVWTIKNDDLVDELHKSIIKKIIKKKLPNVKTHPELKSFINLINTVKEIERIGDCATNIAEAAIYSTLGKDVRHMKNEIEDIVITSEKVNTEKNLKESDHGKIQDTGS